MSQSHAEAPRFDTITLKVEPTSVALLTLARPAKSNAVSMRMLEEIPEALAWCERHNAARAVVLTGEGQNFCGGLDLETLAGIRDELTRAGACPGRTREAFRRQILAMQVRPNVR